VIFSYFVICNLYLVLHVFHTDDDDDDNDDDVVTLDYVVMKRRVFETMSCLISVLFCCLQ